MFEANFTDPKGKVTEFESIKAIAVSKTVTKLKSKKVYYARVSAFKKVGKTTYKGAWSAVKKAKIK